MFRGPALARYAAKVRTEHRTFKMPFRDLPLEMAKVYVPLKVENESGESRLDGMTAIGTYRRLVVKGAPGAGKSMLLRSLLLAYANGATTTCL
jgi:predicted NACHT family NTPase